MCLYPRLIANPKYKPNKKNGGNIPPVLDDRVRTVAVGCENCIECRKQKARGWLIRLSEDIKVNTNGHFITLTLNTESLKELYNDVQTWKLEKGRRVHRTEKLEGYEVDNAIIKRAVELWLERHRKKHGKSVRHWLVSELGHQNTEHVHLHGIIWSDDIKETLSHWKYGYVWDGYNKNGKRINYVTLKTINYIVKYITKVDAKHKFYKSVILCSAKIGANYNTERNRKNHKYIKGGTNNLYRNAAGYKIALPLYYRNKMYNEEEREKLWIEMLDKQERYICGEKVEIHNTMTEYYELLHWHREKNKQLGYGGLDNWEQREYENDRRTKLIEQRIK